MMKTKTILTAAALGAAGQAGAQPAGWEGFPLGDLDFGSPRVVGGAVLGLLAVGVVLGVIGGPKAASTSAAAANIMPAGPCQAIPSASTPTVPSNSAATLSVMPCVRRLCTSTP